MDFIFDNVETKNNSISSLLNNPNPTTGNPFLFKYQPNSTKITPKGNAKDLVDFFVQGN